MSRFESTAQRAGIIVAVILTCGLISNTPSCAQPSDGWSFVVTPQMFISHIAKNGFAAPPTGSALTGGIFPTDGDTIVTDPYQLTSSNPQNTFNPQYGIQIAAQKGRLTLSGAFQYVDFKTINDITVSNPGNPPLCFDENDPSTCLTSGQRYIKESVKTTRIDFELAASYFFPDVVPNWLDLSAGGGFKFIYAASKRTPFDLSGFANVVQNEFAPPGIYTICPDNPCLNPAFEQQVHEDTYLYAVTFPMSANMHLTRDGKWFLRVGASPLLGAEVRNDKNVAYSFNLPATVTQFIACAPSCIQVNRLDGTKFAYGVTGDVLLNWSISEAVSAYAGVRVQYIHGHDTYLAYGPLVGVSMRFGGK